MKTKLGLDIIKNKDLIISLYQKGSSTISLSKQFKCSTTTIWSYLKTWGVSIRNTGAAHRKYLPKIPDVNNLTDKDYYWAGIIASDGCLQQKGQNYTIKLQVQKIDKKLLKDFCDYLSIPYSAIKAYQHFLNQTNKYYKNIRVQVSSKELFDFYNSFGITPRKSLTYQVDDRLKNNPHFWRGMIDGDGYVFLRKNKYPGLGLTGTYDVCKNFNLFVKQILKVDIQQIYKVKKCKGNCTFQIECSKSRDVISIADLLYINSQPSTRLARKYKKYLGWVKR